jgi:hypothetical protein
MKFKTTAKAIREQGGRIVCAGYCDLSHLLSFHEPVAYTCGMYGWNFDVYCVHGLTITTGYRGMVGRRANNIAEYERKAREIRNSWSIPYEEQKERIEKLLEEFCKQA